MADGVAISALPSATTPLLGTELVPLVQGGTTKHAAISDISEFTVSGTSGGVAIFVGPNSVGTANPVTKFTWDDALEILHIDGSISMGTGISADQSSTLLLDSAHKLSWDDGAMGVTATFEKGVSGVNLILQSATSGSFQVIDFAGTRLMWNFDSVNGNISGDKLYPAIPDSLLLGTGAAPWRTGYFGAGRGSSADIGTGADGTVTTTVDAVGDPGDAYTIEVVAGVGLNVPMTAAIVGQAITVTLGTDGAGVLDPALNTATLVAAAVNALTGVSSVASGTGNDPLTGAEGPTSFSGGSFALYAPGGIEIGTTPFDILESSTGVLQLGDVGLTYNGGSLTVGTSVVTTSVETARVQSTVALGTLRLASEATDTVFLDIGTTGWGFTAGGTVAFDYNLNVVGKLSLIGADAVFAANVDALTYSVGGTPGVVTATFLSGDVVPQTITVTNGIITSVV